MTGYSAAGSYQGYRQTSTNRLAKPHFDVPLLLFTYALAIFGLVAITVAAYSPSSDTGLVKTLFARIMQSRDAQKQGIFLLVSPIIISAVLSIDYRFLGNALFANLLFYGACGFLVLAAVTGTDVNNVRGWMKLLYDYTVQPAELAKLAVIVRLAQLLSRKENPIASFMDFVRVALVLAIPVGLIVVAGEMGSAVVFIFFFMVMLLIAGVDSRVLFGIILGGAGMLVPLLLVMRKAGGYRYNRLLGFFLPSAATDSVKYQQQNSIRAVGSGGLYGQGLFKSDSLTSLNFVPEKTNDFIFSSIGETMGFIGSIALLILYLLLVMRMVTLAIHTQDKFGQLIIVGVLSMVMYHIFQGVGMAIGLMPVMGIPLPFVSYGGSNLTLNMASIALVLNVTMRKPQLALTVAPPPRGNARLAKRAARERSNRQRGRAMIDQNRT